MGGGKRYSYDAVNMWVVDNKTRNIVCQMWGKTEEPFDEYESFGPKIAAALNTAEETSMAENESINEEGSLLPCPFCGGEPTIGGTSRENVYIHCLNCMGQVGSKNICFFSFEDAMYAWNRRSQDGRKSTSTNKPMPKCRCGSDAVCHCCRICWCMEIDSHKQAGTSA